MKKGEIWLCELPTYDGHEQKGVRPCILISSPYLEIMTIIPLTSNIDALRFDFTYLLKSDKVNNLERDSIALIFQIQSIDSKRAIKLLGKLNKQDTNNMIELIKRYLI